jgi:hypothetical protein
MVCPFSNFRVVKIPAFGVIACREQGAIATVANTWLVIKQQAPGIPVLVIDKPKSNRGDDGQNT